MLSQSNHGDVLVRLLEELVTGHVYVATIWPRDEGSGVIAIATDAENARRLVDESRDWARIGEWVPYGDSGDWWAREDGGGMLEVRRCPLNQPARL